MSKTLTIYLAADVKKLSSGLRNGQQELRGFAGTVDRLGSTFTNMLGPAMIGVGIAAGAMAAKFAVDGVQAFVADEAAAAKLSTTLDNLGLAQDTTEVEAMIDALQRQSGVADDALRPAFDRLIRSVGDTDKATQLLNLSLSISQGAGKSLDAVVQALGKAYDGNTAGLSKLGAGIDKTVLATGNMDTITKELSRTFDGQAQTAAGTYQGQLARLSVGFGELQESFGAGFLSALGATESKTGDLMQAMQDLEPAMQDIGTAVGDLTVELADMVIASNNAAKAGKRFLEEPNWEDLGTLIRDAADSNKYLVGTMVQGIPIIGPYANMLLNLVGGYDSLAGSANDAYLGVSRTAMALGKGVPDIDANAAATSRWNAQAQAAGKTIKYTGGNLEEYFTKAEKAAGGAASVATASDVLRIAFDEQSKATREAIGELDGLSAALDAEIQKATDFKAAFSAQLLAGIDLGAAQDAGEGLAGGTLAAFNNQIAQAEWFGNVLGEIKRQGADQALIDEIASMGPAAGGKLAQTMIDDGLVLTFNDRLNDVVTAANKVAQAMVPEWIQSGIDSAEGNLNALLTTTLGQVDALKTMGKGMGKTVGSSMAAEIAKAVAKAVEAAEAAKTAAAAERASQIAAERIVVSEQQIAQQFNRLIQASNARTGYTSGTTTLSPVLG